MNPEDYEREKKKEFTRRSLPLNRDKDWIDVLDELPYEGEKVLCYGHRTICCQKEMEEASEHKAIFKRIVISYKKDDEENMYDVITRPFFDLPDQPEMFPCSLIFVSRWMKAND